MSSPKHLWSGDWQDDSAARAQQLAERREQTPEPARSHDPEQSRTSARSRDSQQTPKPARSRDPEQSRTPEQSPTPQQPRDPEQLPKPARSHDPEPAAVRASPRRMRSPWMRPALVIALGLLVIAGGTYGLTRVLGGGGPRTASANAATPWLGIDMESLPVNRVVITAVVPGGPADAAGLGPGDLIAAVARHPISVPGDVTAAIAGLHPGERVEVQIERGAATFTTRVTLVARPAGHP
jgi:hypothetical protein